MVPYKESKLTKMLKGALSGNGLLLVICCISQEHNNCLDTISTLHFAQACKSLTAAPKVCICADGPRSMPSSSTCPFTLEVHSTICMRYMLV